jgi:hypothetical protein
MYAIIATIVVCSGMLAVWNWILTRAITSRIVMQVKELDSSIVTIVDNMMNGEINIQGEQMNPFQILLYQFVEKKLNQIPTDVAVVTPIRDETGKYVRDTSS